MTADTPTLPSAKPFIKWAGGKSQLLPSLRKLYPDTSAVTKYVEPFVGGGAVLFDVINTLDVKEAVINDINPNLINAYRVVKEDLGSLLEVLSLMQSDYIALDEEGRAEFYYAQRDAYNLLTTEALGGRDVLRAALFIFLNKTCFNGLYRVNRNGKFNVPHGRYKNPAICNTPVLTSASKALQGVEIRLGDYRDVLPLVDEKTFLYLDPPYRPLTKSASFNSYDSSVFDDEAQRELARFIAAADNKGSKILLSNSDPKNSDPKDNFFDDLYADRNIQRVAARRAISSKSSTRGEINEIIVTNYVLGEDTP